MDSKGAFAKVVQKTLSRTKAKVLQNLGKADKTTDEKFEEHVSNFTRQQAAASRLQKEVKHYVNCVRAMTTASKNLYAVIRETYESDWVDLHNIDSAIRSLDMLYSNYEAELFERVCSDLHTYVELFNPMKEKISKRRRKLLDYDNAKHGYESACNAKKPDDIKISKACDSMQETERLYNDLNAELHRELPKFYNYRIDFIASNLSRLFSTESTFHLETGKITDELHNIMEQVPKADEDDYQIPGELDTSSNNRYNITDQSGLDLSSVNKSMDSPGFDNKFSYHSPAPCYPEHGLSYTEEMPESAPQQNGTSSSSHKQSSVYRKNENIDNDTILLAESIIPSDYDVPAASLKVSDDGEQAYNNDNVTDEGGCVYEKVEPGSGSGDTDAVVPGQQVLATHNYNAEDEDELSFEAGEIINVVEFDDPDEQDEGWLMGISKKTGRKGVFPENFTRKIIQVQRKNLGS